MKIIFSHPTGNSNVRIVAKALAHANLLASFHTCIALFENNWYYRFTKYGILKEFRRRSFDPILQNYTYTRPFNELGRMAAQKLRVASWLRSEGGIFNIDKIYSDLDVHVARHLKNVEAIYAYEDGALQSFQKGKTRKILCFYDLPTGYWRASRLLLENERKNRPDWAITLKNFRDSEAKLKRKDQELALADIIFVASNFTKNSLKSYPGKLGPVKVVPYGFPEVYDKRTYRKIGDKKLKLLFVGSLSQAKGIANLFEAVEFLNHRVELTVVGRKVTEDCPVLDKALAKNTWIPSLPNDQVLSLMRDQDLFVFPSLFEGYGLVIAEAMSQGTPVITTNRTCGADFIEDGKNGWLIEAANTQSLIDRLENILNNTACIEEVGKGALDTAKKRPFNVYGHKMIQVLTEALNKEF